jgi:broad specificity phosphatase PhoE
METVGKYLKANGILPNVLYTSTLLRARQSSKETAKSFPGIKIIKEKELQDADGPGLHTQAWLLEIEEQGFDVYSYPETISLIETKEEVVNRMLGVIEKIKSNHKGETVIVVSHGDTIAFLKHKLMNPNAETPSTLELKKNKIYPEKGEAWYVELDTDNGVMEERVISSLKFS